MTVTKIGHVLVDLGSQGAGSVVLDISKGNYFRVNATATTITIAAPIMGTRESPGPPPGNVVTVPVLGNAEIGDEILIEVKAAAASLAITWNAAFKQAATNPTSGNRRLYAFCWDGTSWVQTSDGVLVAN